MELIDTFDHYKIDNIHLFTLAELSTLHVYAYVRCTFYILQRMRYDAMTL